MGGPRSRGDQAGELAEEERVAAARPRGAPHLGPIEVPPDRGPQQIGDGLLVESTQDTAFDVGAAEQVGPDLLPPDPRPAGAPGRATDQSAAGRVAQQQPQRQQRRLVGPLDVVDDEQTAAVGHHHVPERGEEREPVLGAVRLDLGYQLAAHPERRRAVFGALRPPDPRRGGLGERPHQGRLADARLALDDDEPRGSLPAGVGRITQPRQVVVAAEQPARHARSLTFAAARTDGIGYPL